MSYGEIKNYYERTPVSGNPPKQIVMLLHGLGSNGRDLISLAPMWAHDLPDALFISPDAPFPCDMVPPGYPDSYQWFSLQDRSPDKMLAGAQTAAPVLDSFITETVERYGLSADKLALVGFSQGTMMSLYVGPRYPEKLAGILGYSGALIGEAELNSGGEFSRLPVRLIHGEADDVVPAQAYHHARKSLEEAGFEVSGHTTPGLMHSIDEAGIASGGEFLKSVLS